MTPKHFSVFIDDIAAWKGQSIHSQRRHILAT
jgi:hypothetical protein